MEYVKAVVASALKCMSAALVMGLGIFYVHSVWLAVSPTSGLTRMILELAVLVAVGMVIYAVVAKILRCEELQSVMDMVRPVRRTTK